MNAPDIAAALVTDPALIWLVRAFGLAGLAAAGVLVATVTRSLHQENRHDPA